MADPASETLAVGTDGKSRRARRPSRSARSFASILFEDGRALDELQRIPEPDHFGDLHLGQLFASISAQKPDYDLEPFFRIPLSDRASIEWRQDVVRDLQDPAIRSAVTAFAASQAQMRSALKEQKARRHPLEQQRWFLDAAIFYCEGVEELAAALAAAAPASVGMKAFLDHLTIYTKGSRFRDLRQRASAVAAALRTVRYTVIIRDSTVRVKPDEDEADFAAEIGATFAMFAQPGHEGWFSFRISDEVTRVDQQLLERVARVHPDPFAGLAAFSAEEPDFADSTIIRFDREVQFYLSFLERVESLEGVGLATCLPDFGSGRAMEIVDGFDLALASELARQVPKRAPVKNDARLAADQSFLMISGPNQGGKTTFARMVGQVHYLASLGLPVPASRACVPFVDAIFTHFEREESFADAGGKLHEDLVRIHAILAEATNCSLLIFNEIFTSATLEDAARLSKAIAGRLRALGGRCVWVTFIDEIATLDGGVSMVAEVRPWDPSARTYRILRQPPLGLANAQILADRYGVSYERVKERMAQ